MRYTKKLFVVYLLLCGSALLLCAGCKKTGDKGNTQTFELEKSYQRGSLTVHIRLDKAKLTIADTLLLELEAAVDAGYEVKMPKIDKALENFGIVDWDNLGNKLGENNAVVSTYRYKLEPFLSGTYALPAFTFEFYDVNNPQTNKYELTTEPINIEVASLLGEQKAELKIADIEGVVSMPADHFYRWICLLVAAGILGGVILRLNRRRQQAKEPVRIFKSAYEIAYDHLRALIDQDFIKAGKIKEFYERISDILRHYIEHRFNLKAPERTTEEFLAELASANILAEAQQKRLKEFLQHCDLVKFARYNPTAEQIQKTFDLVKDFIETTKSDDKKIDVTEINAVRV